LERHRTKTLPAVLYGYETWDLILQEEYSAKENILASQTEGNSGVEDIT
jgi:dihydrofolate reductase